MRIWDPATGTTEHIREGHTDWVTAVWPVRVQGRELLASAGRDTTVRIWDPPTGTTVAAIPMHASALMSSGGGGLFFGLEAGVLAVQVSGPPRRHRIE